MLPLLALTLLAASACTHGAPVRDVVPPDAPAESIPNSDLIPLSAEDAHWGAPDAPVTLVAFLDFECPYCSRVHSTLESLKESYGPKQLRVAIKHNPLTFHPRGIPAASAAQAIRVGAGSAAFFDYAAKLFENPKALTDDNLKEWASDYLSEELFQELAASRKVRSKVRLDQHLANRIGVEGVPAFFINGAALVGARPALDFKTLIDHELKAAHVAIKTGIPRAEVYHSRVVTNFQLPEGSGLLKVPVADSPTLGPKTAPITLVEFADFECTYCARAHRTVQELMRRYPGKIRWVLKHAPLPNHRYAQAAALLTIAVRQHKGDDAFWSTTHQLMTEPQLNGEVLLQTAEDAGIELSVLQAMQRLGADHPRLQQDADLAMDLNARGTPHFFVNGRRLPGAQPIEVFVEAIELELAHAEKLVEQGVSPGNLYAHLQQSARLGPGLTKVEISTPAPQEAPTRGALDAPVVLQVFSDFECPYCSRVMPVIQALEQQFPDKLRVVWRHLPLSFHRGALPAANAATEVWRQKGDHAFWSYAEMLFQSGDAGPKLEVKSLARSARQIGLSEREINAVIQANSHDALIQRDIALATRLGLNGTPSFTINGYVIKGAQPLRRFERLVRRALEESGVSSQVTAPAEEHAALPHTPTPPSVRTKLD